MIIYSMTATFGKLENQTLTLNPKLNIIHAPNEWGKSTWCAFLLNMLYGIDTKERSKLESLADKDRYAPWSGAPMSGRIALNWNGRDITIERSSNNRIPMGVFRAYETETGIDVPELTASNCGQMLLGVERTVFTRAGFLRLSDMAVTQDDALRRRLNNLVTTGDESGDADKLGQTLKDLKNKCRSNKSNGLIPEAEAQRTQLQNQLWDLQELEKLVEQSRTRQKELNSQAKALENHMIALEYENSKKTAQQIQEANALLGQAGQTLALLEKDCASLPSQQQAQEKLRRLEQLQLQQSSLAAETLPDLAPAPVVPAPFEGLSGNEAVMQAKEDTAVYNMLCKKPSALYVILALLSLALGVGLFFVNKLIAAIFPLIAIVLIIIRLCKRSRQKKDIAAMTAKYGTATADNWLSMATEYQQAQGLFEASQLNVQALADNLAGRKEATEKAIQQETESLPLTDALAKWEGIIDKWNRLENAQKEWEQAKRHADMLSAVAKTPQPPQFEDSLTLNEQQTRQALAQTQLEQNQVQLKLGQYMGQMDAIGQEATIRGKLEAVNNRIARLETYNGALELAQNTLYKTTLALQRRFSPQITKRTQALFSKLTGNRYQRITLGEDMSLQTAAENEITLTELRRRSAGTIDQLYMALRLAVAQELTPNAPLILDDALVRFDDTRVAAAMDVLKEEAENKQVIVFTCQKREAENL